MQYRQLRKKGIGRGLSLKIPRHCIALSSFNREASSSSSSTQPITSILEPAYWTLARHLRIVTDRRTSVHTLDHMPRCTMDSNHESVRVEPPPAFPCKSTVDVLQSRADGVEPFATFRHTLALWFPASAEQPSLNRPTVHRSRCTEVAPQQASTLVAHVSRVRGRLPGCDRETTRDRPAFVRARCWSRTSFRVKSEQSVGRKKSA